MRYHTMPTVTDVGSAGHHCRGPGYRYARRLGRVSNGYTARVNHYFGR
ncbi:MAG: hypothetical protein JWP83_3340 [Mycobacterium sp.]|nr:hypothetical protein [Mycobacterium sp.]